MNLAGRFKGIFRGMDGYAKMAVAVIVAAAILRFALAAVSHPAGDSCWHLSVARFIAENGRIPFAEPFGISDRQFFSAAPLFHLAAAAVYRFFSLFGSAAAEFAVKLVSPLFGSLTLPFVFLLGRKMFSARIGFLATVFVAFLPLHINSSVVSFVDSLAALLAVIAVYFLLQKRILLSALFIGLGMGAKQTMLIMLPLFFLAILVYCKGRLKDFLAKSVVSGLVIAVIGLPWFVRSYILFGNPVWPFLSGFFSSRLPDAGIVGSRAGFSLANLFSLDRIAGFHLELFGAPTGSLGSLSFISLPFLQVFVAAWIAMTLLFLLPFLAGIPASTAGRGKRCKWLLYGWIISFLFVVAVFVVNTGLVSARYFLPAVPAVGILWALGLDAIVRRFASFRLFNAKLSVVAVVFAAVAACIIAFSAVEAAKTAVADRAWSVYDDDFQWVKANTPENALIGYNGQCMSYNVHRFSNYNLEKADYAWVNQGFRVEPVSIVEPDILDRIERDFTPVYESKKTGTVVYKRK